MNDMGCFQAPSICFCHGSWDCFLGDKESFQGARKYLEDAEGCFRAGRYKKF